jgi:hypothetical protein
MHVTCVVYIYYYDTSMCPRCGHRCIRHPQTYYTRRIHTRAPYARALTNARLCIIPATSTHRQTHPHTPYTHHTNTHQHPPLYYTRHIRAINGGRHGRGVPDLSPPGPARPPSGRHRPGRPAHGRQGGGGGGARREPARGAAGGFQPCRAARAARAGSHSLRSPYTLEPLARHMCRSPNVAMRARHVSL